MDKWFTIDQIDEDTYIISEYRHWEETHCYLLNGSSRSLLIDTGLGICNIYDEVMKLTNKPITAVATHIHWDHIGGHKYFPDFYAHAEELSWLNGEFPLTIETIREMVADRCDLPDGYDTKVGSFGSRFSGGEKQRIAIARAILKNAPILILDEATSAADPENQVEIDKAIENLCKGKTVIVVAHRLGVLKMCNRVAVVENHTITSVGTHDEQSGMDRLRNGPQYYLSVGRRCRSCVKSH